MADFPSAPEAPDPTIAAPPSPVATHAAEDPSGSVPAALVEVTEAEVSEASVEGSEAGAEVTAEVSESVQVSETLPTQPGPAEVAPVPTPGISSAVPGVPSIATSLEVPPLEKARGSGEAGGEWELLISKVNAWFQGGDFQHLWQQLRGPLRAAALLIGLLVLLRVYGSLVRTIDAIPLVGGLLELVGLIALGRFCFTDLARSGDRQRLISQWSQRWQQFSGRS